MSSILGAINFLVTVRNMRAPGMTYFRMPLFVWGILATSILVIAATPVLTGALVLMLFDRLAATEFFNAVTGGDPLLWPNVLWFYSHRAVYILVLPGWALFLMGCLCTPASPFSDTGV